MEDSNHLGFNIFLLRFPFLFHQAIMQCDVGMVFLGRRERISMEEALTELQEGWPLNGVMVPTNGRK